MKKVKLLLCVFIVAVIIVSITIIVLQKENNKNTSKEDINEVGASIIEFSDLEKYKG